ncbi:SIMPL domain-containing protein [Paenibacillus nasutitermitis]|uniref:Oxidative stress defense protein n=1 Tax=Paenibacillus nasutitermitis TaxID=1652958 RepID=A0A917E3A9_9BACL|nr:SIMPL domain-containing protein [Paenibacillus nasutitermitis]GGD98959.1 oxidative stress defense protein [Paenibacillus nasutitermitis]
MFERKTTDSVTETERGQIGIQKGRKKWILTAALAVAVGIGAVIGANGGLGNVYAAEEVGNVQKGIITVSGKGELQASPDVAYINVGVETRAATAKEAQANNATKFAALQKVLFEKNKLATKDVKTTNFNVQPQYTYNEKDGTNKVTGYVATHSIQITSRELTTIGQLLDQLSTAGANRMEGVQFDTEKQDQYELQALEKAMANAKSKAETLAKAAGKQVKEVVNVTQTSAGSVPIYNNRAMAESAQSSADGAGSVLQTGEITLSAHVQVTYEMQ